MLITKYLASFGIFIPMEKNANDTSPNTIVCSSSFFISCLIDVIHCDSAKKSSHVFWNMGPEITALCFSGI